MEISKNRWWLRGLFFGIVMFLFMNVLWPVSQDEVLTVGRLARGLAIWIVIGLVYGWLLRLLEPRMKSNHTKEQPSD